MIKYTTYKCNKLKYIQWGIKLWTDCTCVYKQYLQEPVKKEGLKNSQ